MDILGSCFSKIYNTFHLVEDAEVVCLFTVLYKEEIVDVVDD